MSCGAHWRAGRFCGSNLGFLRLGGHMTENTHTIERRNGVPHVNKISILDVGAGTWPRLARFYERAAIWAYLWWLLCFGGAGGFAILAALAIYEMPWMIICRHWFSIVGAIYSRGAL